MDAGSHSKFGVLTQPSDVILKAAQLCKKVLDSVLCYRPLKLLGLYQLNVIIAYLFQEVYEHLQQM